ncbi:hypothetical protein YC2023_101456 [Brassica napus]
MEACLRQSIAIVFSYPSWLEKLVEIFKSEPVSYIRYTCRKVKKIRAFFTIEFFNMKSMWRLLRPCNPAGYFGAGRPLIFSKFPASLTNFIRVFTKSQSERERDSLRRRFVNGLHTPPPSSTSLSAALAHRSFSD